MYSVTYLCPALKVQDKLLIAENNIINIAEPVKSSKKIKKISKYDRFYDR